MSTTDPAPRADLAMLDALAEAIPLRKRLRATCAADIAPVRVEWLWRGWLPFGKLVSFDGAPGIGKSTLMIDLIARATRGGPMPRESQTFAPVTAMIAGVEDGWADTIRPRLDAANAMLKRVHCIDASAEGGQNVTVPNDVLELAEQARDLGATWLHIDAIMGALSEDVSAYSDHEVRRALGPLRAMAERSGLLVTFIRHPRKAGGSGINAGGGSVAFGALARAGLFAGFDPADTNQDLNLRRRVLAVAKNNLAPMPSALSYSVVPAPNGAGCISWGEPSHLSADDLAQSVAIAPRKPREPGREPEQRSAAEQFLEGLLGDGLPHPVNEIMAAARASGHSWRTVQRAKQSIGVMSRRQGFGEGSVWSLPGAAGETRTVAPIAPESRSSTDSGADGTNGASASQLALIAVASRDGGAGDWLAA